MLISILLNRKRVVTSAVKEKRTGTMHALNTRIRSAREKLHLSQQYVADYLGIGRSAVVDIEKGRRKVSAEELDKLSNLFLVPVEELLHGRSGQTPNQMFARSFEELDDDDKREILNLIEFKRAMKLRS